MQSLLGRLAWLLAAATVIAAALAPPVVAQYGTLARLKGFSPPLLSTNLNLPFLPYGELGAVRGRDYLPALIVLDPGHGGDDRGVVGPSGVAEKDYTLDLARRLKKRIEEGLGVRVFLTRTTDESLSTTRRVGLANNRKGELFLSLHLGGSFVGGGERALSLYLPATELWQLRGEPTEESPGTEGSVKAPQWGWERAHQTYRPYEILLARSLRAELRRHYPESPVHLRYAPLIELEGLRMPGIVAELGILTNPEGERQLREEASLQALTEGLFQGILGYIETVRVFGGA